MKKYLFFLIGIIVLVFYHSINAVDSTENKSAPTINALYPTQNLVSPGTVNNDVFDIKGEAYPPCPGDPSNPSFPRAPICPDVNGKWPTDFNFHPDERYIAASTYSKKIDPDNLSPYTYAQVYCPDTCIATRYATPEEPANSTAPVPITNYQTAICPSGYAQIASFNPQPAIIKIEASNVTVDYPIDSMSKYNQYVEAGYDCGIDVFVSTSNYCTTAGTSSQWQNDYYMPYPETFNFVGKSKKTNITLINGFVGYYKDMTNFNDCYYSTPPDCSSKVPSTDGCPWPASAYLRKYRYNAYYKKCTRAEGYYYSTAAYVPASIICSRVKTEFKAVNE